jgi:dTMP kinase
MEKGRIIALEGIDASGKATQAKMLLEFLKRNGKDGVIADEPCYDTPTGKLIYDTLHSKGKHDDYSLQLLFTVDRAMHVHSLISPTIEKGHYVVADRYLLSTIAYSMAAGMNGEKLKAIKGANGVFPQPDFTFILDIDPEESAKRMVLRTKNQNRKTDKFEDNIKFLRKVREAYLKLPGEYPNIFIIDAKRDADEVHGKIIGVLEKRL